VNVAAGVGVEVAPGGAVGVWVAVAVCVGVKVRVGVGVDVPPGGDVGVRVAVGVGVGVCTTGSVGSLSLQAIKGSRAAATKAANGTRARFKTLASPEGGPGFRSEPTLTMYLLLGSVGI